MEDETFVCTVEPGAYEHFVDPVYLTNDNIRSMTAGISEWLVWKTSGFPMTASDITAGKQFPQQTQTCTSPGNSPDIDQPYRDAVSGLILAGCANVLASELPNYEPFTSAVCPMFLNPSEMALLFAIRDLFRTKNMVIPEPRSDLAKFLTMMSIAGYNYDGPSSQFVDLLQAGAWAKLSSREGGDSSTILKMNYERLLRPASETELERVKVMCADAGIADPTICPVELTEHTDRHMYDFNYFCAQMSIYEYNLIHMAYRVRETFVPSQVVGWPIKAAMGHLFEYYSKGFDSLYYDPTYNGKRCTCPRHCCAPDFYDCGGFLTPDTPEQHDAKYPRFYVATSEQHQE